MEGVVFERGFIDGEGVYWVGEEVSQVGGGGG
jgi:hypothetical protein